MTSDATAARFDALADAEAADLLLGCLRSAAWVQAVLDGRPYRSGVALAVATTGAAAALDDAALAGALSAHPRIGERPEGDGAEAQASRREQSGLDPADAEVAAALRQANLDYEKRFGHVFLIRAAGRGPAEILAAARERLGHDNTTEAGVVREQLGEIARLRLEAGLAELSPRPR